MNKLNELISVFLVIIVLSCCSYTLLNKIKPKLIKQDNFVEQYVEDVIEDKTGVLIALTPDDATGGFLNNVDFEKLQNAWYLADEEED